MSEKTFDHAEEARAWVAGAEDGLAEAWEGDDDQRADALATQQVAATLALVHETARLADAQERTATAVEALALFRAADGLMTTPATEVQARDMYRAGIALITGDSR